MASPEYAEGYNHDEQTDGHDYEHQQVEQGQENDEQETIVQENADAESAQHTGYEDETQDQTDQGEDSSQQNADQQLTENNEDENAGDVSQLNADTEDEGLERNGLFDDATGTVEGEDIPDPEAEHTPWNRPTDAEGDPDVPEDEDADEDGEAEEEEPGADDFRHDPSETPEGGDYVEYDEYNEDDDDRFGEDLPQDFGGNVDASHGANDPHVSLDQTAEAFEPDVNDMRPSEPATNLEGVLFDLRLGMCAYHSVP